MSAVDVIALGAALTTLAVLGALWLLVLEPHVLHRRVIRRRIAESTGRLRPRPGEAPDSAVSRLRAAAPPAGWLAPRLARAGLEAAPLTVWLVLAVGVAGAAVGLRLGTGLGLLVCALAAGAAGWGLLLLSLAVLTARRRNRFADQFPEAIDLMVRGVRSGLPIGETIVMAGTDMPQPLSTVFAQASSRVRLGDSLEAALGRAGQNLKLAEFDFFMVALSVQRETGGNLAETLENLSTLLRKRRQMRLKIRAMSSEARASALIVGSLPFVVGGILFSMNPDYVGDLLFDPRGRLMLIGALVLQGLGATVMAKMVRFQI